MEPTPPPDHDTTPAADQAANGGGWVYSDPHHNRILLRPARTGGVVVTTIDDHTTPARRQSVHLTADWVSDTARAVLETAGRDVDQETRRARAAAHALTQVLTRATTAGLVAAAWSIHTEPHVELEGVLPAGDTRALQRWANEFDTVVDWGPIAGLGYPEVHFVIDGVSVRVWTRLTLEDAM